MTAYETVLVIKPQLSDEQVAELVEKVKKVIAEKGGEVMAEDKWGRRKLAYPVQKAREGFYAYLKFQGPGSLIEELNHHFRVQDSFLRAMMVRASTKKPKEPAKKAAVAA